MRSGFGPILVTQEEAVKCFRGLSHSEVRRASFWVFIFTYCRAEGRSEAVAMGVATADTALSASTCPAPN